MVLAALRLRLPAAAARVVARGASAASLARGRTVLLRTPSPVSQRAVSAVVRRPVSTAVCVRAAVGADRQARGGWRQRLRRGGGVLSLFGLSRETVNTLRSGSALYGGLREQAMRPEFFDVLGISRGFGQRSQLLMIHVWMAHARLRRLGAPARACVCARTL